MMIPGFDTLAEALHASFPPDSCRLLAVSEHGDAAVALFDTRPSAEPYLYEVHYDRNHGRWSEGSSGNGPGWHRPRPDSDIGVATIWDQSPPGADRVRAERDGRVVEEAVVNGVYFLVWWDVPLSHPRVTAFRVKGEWVRAPTTWEQFNAERNKMLRAMGVRGFKLIALAIFAGVAAAPFASVAAGLLGLSPVIAGAAGGLGMAILVALILTREGSRPPD